MHLMRVLKLIKNFKRSIIVSVKKIDGARAFFQFVCSAEGGECEKNVNSIAFEAAKIFTAKHFRVVIVAAYLEDSMTWHIGLG